MLRFAVRDGSSRMHACPLLSVQPPALHVTLRRGEPRGHHRTRTATMGGAFAAYKHATTGQPEANVGARLPVLTGRGGVRRHSISRCVRAHSFVCRSQALVSLGALVWRLAGSIRRE